MKKRLLATFFVLCLALSLLPTTALADELWNNVYTAEDLTMALANGGNIRLASDIDTGATQTWVIETAVVLDLNGCKITSGITGNDYLFTLNSGSLTVTDASAGQDGCISVLQAQAINIKGTGSKFTLENGTIEAKEDTLEIVYNAEDTVCEFKGGRITAEGGNKVIGAYGRGTVVNISGGEIEMKNGTNQCFYLSGSSADSGVTLNMTGGKMISSAAGVYVSNYATVNISDDAYIESNNKYGALYIGAYNESSLSNINISGGTIKSTGNNAYAICSTTSAYCNIEISGGQILSESSSKKAINIYNNTSLMITGGTFSSDVTAYLTSGMQQDDDGKVSIDTAVAVASIDGAAYTSLDDAIDAAGIGDTIKLENDITLSSPLTISTSVTINGNLHTISVSDTFDGNMITVYADNTTIQNLIVAGGNKSDYGIMFYKAANGRLENVTAQNNTKRGIYINASTVTAAGTITLSGNGLDNSINVGFGSNISDAPGASLDVTYATLVGVESIYADAGDVARAGAADTEITVTDDTNTFVAVGDSSAGPVCFVPKTAVKDSAKITVVNGSGTPTYYLSEISLQDAIDNADNNATITLAPGIYSGNITFGGKSLAIKAQYPAYQNGSVAAYNKSMFTGTFNTYGGTTASFNKDQKIVIEGIAFYGNGLKIGNNNYNSVGNLEVRYCTMACGNNLPSEEVVNFNQYNYFVKTSGDDGQGEDSFASVVVEDNYITGTLADLVTPIQLWRVDNATVKDNAIVVTDSGDHQAINISKMEEDAQIEITGNMIRGVGGGIYVTTWLLGGRTEGAPGKFTGTVEIVYNTLYCAESEMDPIFAGYEKAPAASGQYYGAFEGTLTVGGNTNNGDPAVAVVGQVPRITATFQDGSTVIDKITGAAPADKLTITTPDALDDNGYYTFAGWSDGSATYGAGEEVTIEADTTFTAVWSYNGPTGGSGSSVSGDYVVSADTTIGGRVTVTPSRVDKGDTVTITVKPDDGYVLDALVVTDKNGGTVQVTAKGDDKYTFTMPGSKVTVEATFVEEGEEVTPSALPFTDVKEGDFFYDAVAWAVENEVTFGTSATTFSPNTACTRAQAVTFLWRAAGSPAPETTSSPFTDVKESDYCYEAVLWAAENGITTGTTATTFSPDATCTRDQIVTFLFRDLA